MARAKSPWALGRGRNHGGQAVFGENSLQLLEVGQSGRVYKSRRLLEEIFMGAVSLEFGSSQVSLERHSDSSFSRRSLTAKSSRPI